jgi:hypothetical protein
LFVDWDNILVFVRPSATDPRKSTNGFAALVQTAKELDLL